MAIIRVIFMLLLLAALLGGALFALSQFSPRSYDRIFIQMEKLGFKSAGSDERQRIDKIDLLDIPFEQREVLKRRTIFIGATKEMVKLAFGDSTMSPRQNQDGKEVWVYFFEDYDRPMFLTFEGDTLIGAQRGASADLAEFN